MSGESSSADSSPDEEYESITVAQDEEVRLTVGPTTAPLSALELSGGVLAALGFVMTPLVTGLPAAYCAWKIRHHRPTTAYLTGGIIAVTSVIWAFLFFGNSLIERLPSPSSLPPELFLALAVLPVVVLFAAVAAVYVLVFQE